MSSLVVVLLSVARVSTAQQPPQSNAAPLQIAVSEQPHAPSRPPLQIAEPRLPPCNPDLGCSAILAIGLETHVPQMHGAAYASEGWSFGFGERASAIVTRDRLAVDAVYDLGLGAGSGGADLRAALEFGLGSRLDFDPSEGLYARGGARLVGMKNNHVGFGTVQLPKLDVGFQRLKGNLVTEIGAEIGLAMGSELAMGRSVPWASMKEQDTSDFARNKSSLHASWGGHFVLEVLPVRVRMQLVRIETGPERGPIDTFYGMLCSSARYWAICTDARYLAADTMWPQGGDRVVESHVWSVGLVVGANPATEM